MWLQRRQPRRAIAAAVVLSTTWICGCGSGGSHQMRSNQMTLAQFGALRLGESQAQVTRQFGLPESRHKVVPNGFIHEEPKGQRCVYYPRRFPDTGDPWSNSDTFQLCFKWSRLRYKWAYIAARA
jgi:hypothetical protein